MIILGWVLLGFGLGLVVLGGFKVGLFRLTCAGSDSDGFPMNEFGRAEFNWGALRWDMTGVAGQHSRRPKLFASVQRHVCYVGLALFHCSE